MTRTRGLWLLGLLLCGCHPPGGPGTSAWGSASTSGSIPTSARLPLISPLHADAGLAGTLDVELIASDGGIADSPACDLSKTDETILGNTVTVSFTPAPGQMLQPGTFPIESCQGGCDHATARVDMTDWECCYSGTTLGQAASGSATLTQVSTDEVAGSFNVTLSLEDGGSASVSGKFSGRYCPDIKF